MQSITTGHSMEMFFDVLHIIFLVYVLGLCVFVSKKIKMIDSRFDQLIENLSRDQEIIQNIYRDIEGVEKALVLLSEKVAILPDMMKEDLQKSLSLLASQSPQSPMKPNNWDSIREAFKGPVRTEGNERT